MNIEGGMTGAKDDEIDSDEEASSGEGESEKYAGAPVLESDD